MKLSKLSICSAPFFGVLSFGHVIMNAEGKFPQGVRVTLQ
jgi:hypothetical protein